MVRAWFCRKLLIRLKKEKKEKEAKELIMRALRRRKMHFSVLKLINERVVSRRLSIERIEKEKGLRLDALFE
jgi:hypothetical protein